MIEILFAFLGGILFAFLGGVFLLVLIMLPFWGLAQLFRANARWQQKAQARRELNEYVNTPRIDRPYDNYEDFFPKDWDKV